MKKMYRIFGICCFLLTCFCACAKEEVADYRTEPYREGVAIVWASDRVKQSDIVCLPEEIDGKKVLAIGDSAFQNGRMSKLILSAGIEQIGDSAFEQCKQLDDLRLNEGLKEIGDFAFYECVSLSYFVTLPSSLERIGAHAFAGCYRLNFRFPETSSLKIIDDNAFNDTDLYAEPRMNFPRLERIGSSAFAGTNLTCFESESVGEIGAGAFARSRFLASVSFFNEDIEFGQGVFEGCLNLRPENMNISKNLLAKPGVLSGYPYFAGASIPAGTTEIPDNAYAGCIGLREVEIPDSVVKIGNRVFENCYSLKSLVIPESVKEMASAFTGSYLTEITFEGDPFLAADPGFPQGITVYCEPQTGILRYCEENGIRFVVL